MIDMPYGLTNPEAAEKNDLGAAGATLAPRRMNLRTAPIRKHTYTYVLFETW